MVKLLICGQVDGAWPLVWERVRKLNAAAAKSKAAPFEALVCLGRVLPFPREFVDGSSAVPVPTYCLPAWDELPRTSEKTADREADAQAALADKICAAREQGTSEPVELFPNCFCLSTHGVVQLAGLNVAYIAGTQAVAGSSSPLDEPSAITFTAADVANLRASIAAQTGTIDFFFSAQYPTHFQHLVAEQQTPSALKSVPTASTLTDLLAVVAPRYHLTSAARASCPDGSDGGGGVFYQRLPYVTPSSRNRKQVTRLIGLCGVSATKDKGKKYLHALQVTPAATQSEAEQQTADIPAGTTQNPYQRLSAATTPASTAEPALKRQRLESSGAGLSAEYVAQLTAQGGAGAQFFYDQKLAARGQRRGGLLAGEPIRDQRDRRPRGGGPTVPERHECWFCLATPSVERHLIVSIGQEAYLAMPKGAINGDHVLIVPIAHSASTPQLSEACRREMARFQAALAQYFASQQKELVVFDRNVQTMGATHCHLQVVGVPRALAAKAKEVFTREGQRYNVTFEELAEEVDLGRATEGKPFFYAELPRPEGSAEGTGRGRVRLLNRVEGKQYMQFGRHAAACLLGEPRRANWKFCVVPKAEEETLTQHFKAQWKRFDFTLEEEEDA